MQFNQFQKELRDRKIEPQNAYMFALVYERLIETERELNTATELLSLFATQLQGFLNLRESDQQALAKLQRHGKPDGIEVQSVAHDPSDDE